MKRQKVYGRSFFSQFIQYVCLRCDVARHRARFMRDIRPPVSQYALWEALREAVLFCESRGSLAFRFRLSYEELSRPLTSSDVEGTICEMAALCTTSTLILSAHTDASFPSTDYERVMTLVILRALLKRIFEGQEFGAAFLKLRPNPEDWVVDTILHGWLLQDRLEAWRIVRDHFSLSAFEFMHDALAQSVPGDRESLQRFLKQEFARRRDVRIDRETLFSLIAQFYELRMARYDRTLIIMPPVSA